MVTCQCNHLTNFGIMMDWSNEVKADDPGIKILGFNKSRLLCIDLDMLSFVLLTMSTVALTFILYR
jgi:hypothetical protein